jgi:uncharacterized protein YecT (DUF1311 family)
MKIRIALAALLIAAAGLPVSLAAQEPELDCRDPRTQTDMNLCAANDYRAADAEMNRVYARLRAALDAEARPRLVEVQRAWLRFRDLQCEFEASGYEGGSMQPFLRSSCLAALTTERTRQLAGMLKEEEG